jgi:WD40 repeat protein
VLAAGLVGWAVASGGGKPVEPATQQPAASAQPAAKAEPADDPLPEGGELRLGTSRFRHGTTIQTFSVSADGKLAVAGSGTYRFGATRVFDLVTGRALYTFDTKNDFVVAAALSPDGKTVAIKKGDHSVNLFDAATGEARARVGYPTANPSTMSEWLVFSPDGNRILVGAATGDGVHLIDFGKLDVVQTFQCAHVFGAAFSPDGKLVAVGGYDRDKNVHFARLWEADTGKELRHFRFGNGGIRCVAFSPDGKTLAVGADGGNPLAVKLYEVATAKEVLAIPIPGGYSIRSLAFAPDGKTVAASGSTGTRLFDTTTGKETLKIDHRAIGLQFAPDGASLIGAVSGTIYRWDTKTGKPLTPASADGVIAQIEVTADGKRVVTRGWDGDAQVWDAYTGEHVRRVNVSWQRGMALSPDGRFLVWPVADESIKYKNPAQPNAIHTGNRLRMLDLTTGTPVDRFGGFEGDAHDLFFADSGKTLVTADHTDGTVRFWDTATGKVQRSFRAVRDAEKGIPRSIWRSQLSPDGKVLAVTHHPDEGRGGRRFFPAFAVRLWDTATGKELHDLAGHRNYVDTAAFSPDGKYLVTASEALQKFAQEQLKLPPDQVFVWDVQTGKAVAQLPTGGTAAAFSADGKTLSVATETGAIQVWDTATWKAKGEFRGHRDRVTALASGPGTRLFSGSVDTTVLAWDTRAAKPPPK